MKMTEPASSIQHLTSVFDSLAAWCAARDYAGHDPFDALNSRLFQATPLRRSRLARLAWTQAFKRSPLNLRPLARVPAGRNAKGTALFVLAWLSRLRAEDSGASSRDEARLAARALLRDLIDARIETAHGAAWGYNFDWQGRAFFAPRGTPTVVPTAFAARALVEAARTFGDEEYLRLARAACEFIVVDLNRSDETADEVCFSYSPLDRTRVFNASLLAAETLARVGALTGESGLTETAARAARYVVRRQRADGSWAYGAEGFQTWSDNFHTAFILTSLSRINASCDDCREEFLHALSRGFDFWRNNFFAADGFPKFTPENAYPADAHSAGAALVALAELESLSPDALPLAVRIAGWTVAHLRDPRGFFHYQRRRTHIVRTPYMRWSQGWMMYGLARLIEVSSKQ
ncbi:MAG: delta-aminolevulinic acid dehydratase [Pyrinomonadaceae bacterium]